MTAERFSERSRAERRRRYFRVALGVLVVAALGALAWMVWFSSVLAVRDVEVSGRTTLKQAQVLRVAQVPQGRPLARVDVGAIEQRVSGLDRVDTVEVGRSWPHTISISIVERKSVVWARVDGQIRGIDRNGIAFRSYGSPPKGLLEATIDVTDARDRLQTAESLASVVTLIGRKDPGLREQVESVTASSKDSIELKLTKGRTVVWGSRDDGGRKLQVLTPLLRLEASRYDVSAPDQPTTTP
ncbi:cell division protein FtsQ/DivIB [Aeromicrobium endophyticum]|uniref:Cell division protein FtsQ n=1 Tax=Aeromicrobium endophyticum TaxID=2292704 RepID=A0A371P388_9ACTN|nr:FtsQ-type POTRA domain-containing protein [Aeromicrobium endophyticum]REK70402.1 cell division protein FtsQ [Aeromicrobium endophyticum]